MTCHFDEQNSHVTFSLAQCIVFIQNKNKLKFDINHQYVFIYRTKGLPCLVTNACH